MSRRSSRAAAAATAMAVLSCLSLVSGLTLISMLGGTSGQSLGQGANGAAFERAVPLLFIAELLKVSGAAAQILVVRFAAAQAQTSGTRWLLLAFGGAGALLIAASGVAGLEAIFSQNPAAGDRVSDLGFLGIAATGGWAALLVGSKLLALPLWLVVTGIVFALLCLASLAFPPVALLSVIVGWPWWIGLARALRNAPDA